MFSLQMGASIGSEAISHLEEVSASGIDAMAESDTVAVILPTTAYILRLKSPPVRQMIQKGVIVALGTDFNPNAYCLAMVSEFWKFTVLYVRHLEYKIHNSLLQGFFLKTLMITD